MDVVVVVVWFNPTQECVDNLDTYRLLVDRVLVVDNSSVDHSELLRDRNVEYIPLLKNFGVGYAFNRGVDFAVSHGCRLLVTMDQDSSFVADDFARYLDIIKLHRADESIAVYSPLLNVSGNSDLPEPKNFIISSGSAYTAQCLRLVGPFNADLFIDEVDTEYCCRVRRAGLRLVAIPSVAMRHKIGSPIVRKFFFIRIRARNHDRVRKYYMTRNRLWVASRYSDCVSGVWMTILKDALKVLLLEHDKGRRLHAMVIGVRDFWRGKLGPAPALFNDRK